MCYKEIPPFSCHRGKIYILFFNPAVNIFIFVTRLDSLRVNHDKRVCQSLVVSYETAFFY